MSNSSEKHNCPLLNFFKGCGCGCESTSKPADHNHSHDHGDSCCGQPHDHTNPEHSHATEPTTTPAPAVTPDTADAANPEQAINQELQAADQDIAAFMDRQPSKQAEQTGEAATLLPLFDATALENKDYVEARDEQRKQATESEEAAGSRAAFAVNDQASNLVDSYSHTGLQSMESNGLKKARLQTIPWSCDYWAICRGILGKRYADPDFPESLDWKVCYDYVQSHSVASIVASGNPAAIDLLSPAEKYDILVGDNNYTLTKKMWEEGRYYYERNGSVAAWMGICHGWAPAAYMLPRPTGTVKVLAADGQTWLTFYPSDIKGLASLLWAKVPSQTKFIGGRCNETDPPVDPHNKRVLSDRCFDTNPGTWHLAVVNQIGASGRSMVIDATFDYEVWNQPMVGYQYWYFNPQRMVYQSNIADATVSKASFTNDKFAQYRSSQTDSMIGIVMDVSYGVETAPTHSTTDSSAADSITKVRYFYDLELDFSGKIIGGEWYFNRHPDFLWTPPPGARAQTRFEPGGSWSEGQPVPANWQSAAMSASSSNHAPLAAIVERLIQLAK